VISPEGCASILWKDAAKAETAAGSLGLTASRLKKLKLIDKIIKEPPGGAHRSPAHVAVRLKETIVAQLETLKGLSATERLDLRYERLMGFSAFERA